MKRFTAIFILLGLFCLVSAEVFKPSMDGRAVVAEFGELPVGLFGKSASFLPGDTVIVTNPATKISIEVMIFGGFDATEGIAIVLSPEAARELYINKGSNVIVQVTKKNDAYTESTILAKTLENYVPKNDPDNNPEMMIDEPVFERPTVVEEFDPVEPLPEETEVVPADEASGLALIEDSALFEKKPDYPSYEDTFSGDEFVSEMTETPTEEYTPYESTDNPPEDEFIVDAVLVPVDAKPPVAEEKEEEPVIAEVEEEPAADETEESSLAITDEPEVFVIPIIPVVEEEPVAEAVEEPVPEEPAVEPVIAEPVEEKTVVIPVITCKTITSDALTKGACYIQIATCTKLENAASIKDNFAAKYPIEVVELSGKPGYQVLIGALNDDEYTVVLERFKQYGYKDAFLRKIR